MSTTFTLNRDKVITGALKKVGAISQGETPNASQIADASDTFNTLIKAWEADGLPLWKIKKVGFPLVQAKAKYNTTTDFLMSTKPMKVMQCLIHDNLSGADIQMITVSRQEYNMLGMKSSQGTPTQYYYDIQNTYGEFNIYPTPDLYSATNRQIQVIFQDQFTDILGANEYPDFPSEWNRALVYGLASDLADEYGVPIRERKLLQEKAMILKADVLSFGQEDASLFMTVSTAGQRHLR